MPFGLKFVADYCMSATYNSMYVCYGYSMLVMYVMYVICMLDVYGYIHPHYWISDCINILKVNF